MRQPVAVGDDGGGRSRGSRGRSAHADRPRRLRCLASVVTVTCLRDRDERQGLLLTGPAHECESADIAKHAYSQHRYLLSQHSLLPTNNKKLINCTYNE